MKLFNKIDRKIGFDLDFYNEFVKFVSADALGREFFPSTKYKKTGVVFLTGLSQIEINLKFRTNKTIPKEVIEKQIIQLFSKII